MFSISFMSHSLNGQKSGAMLVFTWVVFVLCVSTKLHATWRVMVFLEINNNWVSSTRLGNYTIASSLLSSCVIRWPEHRIFKLHCQHKQRTRVVVNWFIVLLPAKIRILSTFGPFLRDMVVLMDVGEFWFALWVCSWWQYFGDSGTMADVINESATNESCALEEKPQHYTQVSVFYRQIATIDGCWLGEKTAPVHRPCYLISQAGGKMQTADLRTWPADRQGGYG